jgi:hypothetical protein
MSDICDCLSEVINDELFGEELFKERDGLVVAYIGDYRWVVIDVETQECCLVSLGDAQVVPQKFMELARKNGVEYHFTA